MTFKDLLCYRSAWLGVALIWVTFYHLPIDSGPFDMLKAIGYGGVDICLFASGIGCFFSLSKDADVWEFYKRRLRRLGPTYLLFIVVWLAFRLAIGQFDLKMALGNLLALQNFTGHGGEFNWYVSAIFLFYLFAPYFKLIAERESRARTILFFVFLVACSVPFWHADHLLIAVSRLPIFFLGFLFGKICRTNKTVTRTHVVLLAVSLVLGLAAILAVDRFGADYIWSHGLQWYPFILITPPLCLLISLFSSLLSKTKWTRAIVSFFSLCGEYSFELYLLHFFLISVVNVLLKLPAFAPHSTLLWLGAGLLLFFLCYLLRRVANGLSTLLFQTKKD